MNILELYDDLRIPYRQHGESPHVTEGWVGIVCPFCGTGTNRYGLGYNLRSGWLSCWKCGPHNLASVIAQAAGISSKDARSLADGVDRVRIVERYERERGRLELPAGVVDLGKVHRRYLESRGFDPDELIDLWKIQGIGLHPRLGWRIFIPIHQRREVVSWTTRLTSDDCEHTERYRGAKRGQEIYPRGTVLYGEDKAKHAIVVHEGPFDVWRTGPGAVCTCGVGFTQTQVRRMSKYPIRAICFDSDRAAQRRARALSDQLAPFPGETYIVQLSGKDPATSPASEIRELRGRFLD